ncbi:MAG: cytochrome c biogenesis CcdA family protein [Beijerinckiaceae bacterium]
MAGLISFASPCVLPLAPAYLSFLAGSEREKLIENGAGERWRVLSRAVSFVLGFATIFVLLGVSASAAGRFVTVWFDQMAVAAGVLLMVFGVHIAGWLHIPFLMRERRAHGPARVRSLGASYAVGLAFAFGWTPCVGPVLASILILSGVQDSVWRGAALLSAYAAGMGLPFVLAAAFAPAFLKSASRLSRFARPLSVASGIVLIVTGALIAIGNFGRIGAWLLRTFPFFERIG